MFPDLRFALRNLRRSPGFVIVAVLTLGLGIGATTAIFTVVNGVLLQPLPYIEPDSIVTIQTLTRSDGRRSNLPGPDFTDLQSQAGAFEAIALYFGGELPVEIGGRTEFASGYLVSPGFFQVFSLPYRLSPESVIVTHAFALRHFGSPRNATSQKVRFNQRPHPIAAVLPPGFQFPRGAEVFASSTQFPLNANRTAHNYRVIAKLRASLDAANIQLDAIGKRLASEYPASNKDRTYIAAPLKEQFVSNARNTLYVLLAAVFLILLIACANVANLLLSRTVSRGRELAVRAALGATRARLLQQLFVESLVLAALAAALGLAFAEIGTRALLKLAPANVPRIAEIHTDATALLFTLAIAMLSTLLFGVAPGWRASRFEIGSRGQIGTRSRLRSVFVVAEVALSFVLVISAGLLLRSFQSLSAVELGYRTEGILVAYASVPATTLEDHRRATAFFGEMLPQLASLPGVASAAAAMGLPLGRYGSNGQVEVEGRVTSIPVRAGFRLASPLYFATLGIPLLEGREFADADRFDAPFAVIVSQSLAKIAFPGENPIGRRVRCGLDSPNWMTIVGVVGEVRTNSPAAPSQPELYMPIHQHPFYANDLQVILRTHVDPESLTGTVRKTIQSVRPDVPVQFTTMQDALAGALSLPRFRTLLLALFAALAIALAMAGVYGVTTYLVTQRTPEIGLRVALGARPWDILGVTLAAGLKLAAAGLALGFALSLAATRLLESLLFGVKPADPLTYGATVAAVVCVSLLAALVPACRAARLDPLAALRRE